MLLHNEVFRKMHMHNLCVLYVNSTEYLASLKPSVVTDRFIVKYFCVCIVCKGSCGLYRECVLPTTSHLLKELILLALFCCTRCLLLLSCSHFNENFNYMLGWQSSEGYLQTFEA